MTFTHGIMTND